ncbi:tetratricopeptide repeat protein [Sphingobium lignivorans]|uniref:TolA-binding protein n=1 Tax=Sphingobium lignivorans TaxID=2735886 RepID=A0ABR6NG62_9SPHN|nr:tetratricopeptide repeat protein [Sphingobium lignivorans]MBB5986268.1 TolA-binding protein [Sphingobium lignivorans]
MKLMSSHRRGFRHFLLAGACLSLGWGASASAQQQPTVERRVDRLEQEMRAVQRKVFPGGQVVVPDVAPPTPTPGVSAGSPAASPVADLTARVSAIEAQLARLTGQVEESGYRLRQLEEAFAKFSAPPPLPAVAPPAGEGLATPPAQAGGKAPASQPRPAPGDTPLLARTEKVAAIEKPSTGNAALDSYTYGFRLWEAKFYPEAQAQLQETVDKYGKDPVASRAQNLLGRAYLDDGKPSTAAKILYENYRVRPKGDRAAESLAWVGEALIKLNRLKDACLAYDELAEVFADNMPATARDMMTKGRTRAKCGA